MDFWQHTWREREEEMRRLFGPTLPPGYVTTFYFAETRIPGACALTFPPDLSPREPVEPRRHWLYLSLGLTQPLNKAQLKKEREAGKKYSAYGFELGILTEKRCQWPIDAIQMFMKHLTQGAEFNWGHRFAFGFHRRPDGELSVFTGFPSAAGVTPVGEIRAMLFWKYLAPLSSFVTSTGNALILIATGITQDEWELAKATSSAHLLLLLLQSGVGQCTDPARASVMSDPRGPETWKAIAPLDAKSVDDHLRTFTGRR